ncbi:MAG: sulfite exporter TauE/SafE family protein [Alloprevotella sp.]
MITLILFTIGAAFVQRTTGFGFGIFIMTVLPFLLPSYGEATTLSGLLAAVTSFLLTVKYRREIAWRKLLPILVTFLLTSFFAVQLLTWLKGETVKYVLGITLVLSAVYFGFFAERIKVRGTLGMQVVLGLLSGIMGGLFGMQGPPAVLYFLAVSESKDRYTALAQCYFLIGNCLMTVYRAQSGFLTHEVACAWCYAVPAVLVGTCLGSLVYNRLSLPALKKLVYLYIGISGIVAIVS